MSAPGPAPETPLPTRRRFIAISAAAAGSALLPGRGEANVAAHRWRGVALGADAEMVLHHPDERAARTLINTGLAEVRRLEKIFSLYRTGSALMRLNAAGFLAAPPPELVELLSRAQVFADLTGGAFDVTVQPLWQLYADHFAVPGARREGPSHGDIENTCLRVGYRHLHVDTEAVRLSRPGMAVTLNGIAQGYITDRVAAMLRRAGLRNVLVNMGEIRALGPRPDGTPWRIGLGRDAMRPVDLMDGAVATSAGSGFRFNDDASAHHLFDPATGRSAQHWDRISVVALDATAADALSTAFSVLDAKTIRRLAAAAGVGVRLVDRRGRYQRI